MTETIQILNASVHSDSRGSHSKFFGKTPTSIRVDDFQVHEVFMTTNNADALRGMHLQVNPAQPKILTCLTGSAIVNVVCLDTTSENFGSVYRTVLGGGAEMVVVPELHALGYRSLEDGTRMLYLAGSDFSAEGDIGVDPFDADLDLDWCTSSEADFSRDSAVLSPRDQELPSFQDFMRERSA